MKMKKIQIKNNYYPLIADVALIGEVREVEALPLSTITRDAADVQPLDGLIVKGYEMKWGKPNENGEVYERNALDDFILSYFVEGGFNLPVDVQHDSRPEWLAGRVIYIERNEEGFYIVAYIPKSYARYDEVKALLQEGILQGFSKFGFATDWKFEKGDDGVEVMKIKKMSLLSVSLVATPANAVKFDEAGEVRNGLKFKIIEESAGGEDTLSAMFN